jgi:tetratricopeptide (TPR) repeat protein
MTTLFLPGWTTRVLIMAGIIGLCIASSPGETATPTEGDLDRAFDAVLADPSDIDAAFEYARIAAALGDYEAAISSLERMLIFDPNLLKVKVELGVLYFRLGSYETAKSYFDQALAHENVPAPIKARIQTLLSQIERNTSPHQYAVAISGGLRYQTNAKSPLHKSGIRGVISV